MVVRGLLQIIFPTASISEGVTLIFYLKHTLTWKMMWMWRTGWLAKLVQGGYIPSAFHPTTRILSQMLTFIAMFI